MDPKLIFYLDQDYQVTYWVIQEDVKIFSRVTIPQAIQLLKNYEFDLIISDPQKIAILKSSSPDTVFPLEGGEKEAPSEKSLIPSLGTHFFR
ncbi:MAG: hypothetical protein HY787_05970 [Deltaproteobacteria bacterium]|nr:hypothetical protein [Deltaproteobacteria bacterium]